MPHARRGGRPSRAASEQLGELIAEMAVHAVRRAEATNGARTAKMSLREIRTNLNELERLIDRDR